MSLRPPSYVSPTTGSDQNTAFGSCARAAWATSASRTTPTRVRVRDPDRTAQEPRLADPLEAGELAVAVEAVAAREHGLGPDVVLVRDDDGDAGPDRALPDDERPVAADQRRVADADARHVRDRVVLPRAEQADPQAELACSHVCLRCPSCGRFPAAPLSSPGVDDPGSPSMPSAARQSCCALAALDRVAPMDCRRGIPRPAGPRPARERAAGTDRAVELPHRRSGRRVLDAPAEGPDPFAEARALLGGWALAMPGAAATAGTAAVRRRARRLPRLRPRAAVRAAARRSRAWTSTSR